MRRHLPIALVLLAVGCGRAEMHADLLSVDAVTPAAVQPGSRLRVTGGGFPAGRPGDLSLEGTMYRPGAEPLAVSVRARGRALSDEVFELRVDGSLVSRLGGRGTFEGTIRLAFAPAHGQGVVSGTMADAAIDFVPDDPSEIAREGRHRERATELFERLGLSVAPVEDGLVVDGVTGDGRAAAAGVTKGDRITAVDHVRIASLADAVPPPGASATTLTIEREGEAAPVRVRVPLDGGGGAAADGALVLGAACAFALGLVLLFIAPTARLTAALAAAIGSIGAQATPRPPRAPRPSVRALARRAGWALVGVLAGTLALGVLPLTARVYAGGVDVGILLFISFVARLVLVPPGAPRAARFTRRLAGFAADGLPAAAAVAAVVLASGTLRVAGIVEAQGGMPWQWYAFKNPVAFVMFPVFVLAALAPVRERADAPRAAAISARMQRYVMAGLATAIFLGGWNLPWVEGDPLRSEPALRLLGTAMFVGKAYVLSLVTGRIEAPAHRHRWAAPLSLACVLVASSTLLAPWPPQVELVAGPVLTSLAALVTIVAIARRRHASPAIPPFPFL